MSGFVLRETGEPRPFTSGKRHWAPVHYTYSVKVVFGHHVTSNLEGTPGDSARVFATEKEAQRERGRVGSARWRVLSLATARRDHVELDGINEDRKAKREAYEAALRYRDQTRLDVLDAVRSKISWTHAELHDALTKAEAAEIAARDPAVST